MAGPIAPIDEFNQDEIKLLASILELYQTGVDLLRVFPTEAKPDLWYRLWQALKGSSSGIARFLGVNRRTVYNYFSAYGLIARRTGKRMMFEIYLPEALKLRQRGAVKSFIEELKETFPSPQWDLVDQLCSLDKVKEKIAELQAAPAEEEPAEPSQFEEAAKAIEEEIKSKGISPQQIAKAVEEARAETYEEKVATETQEDSALGFKVIYDKLQRRIKALEAENVRLKLAWERFSEYVLDRLSSYPRVNHPPKPPERKAHDPHIAMMDLSDIHVGELVKAEETMGLAVYDWETFLRRKEAYIEGVVRVVDDVKDDHPIHMGIIHALGDFATGERNFPLQLARIDKFISEQIVDGSAELADMIQQLAGIYPELIVYCVPGNHSAGKDLTLNLDLLIYRIIAKLLRNQDNVKFIISQAPYLGYELSPRFVPIQYKHDNWRWRYLITHGHMVKRYYGIPYYGLDRMVAKITKTTGIVWDAIFAAHHHEEAMTRNWWVNGSWVGGTHYSVEKMQAAEPPAQWFRLWHPQWGISWHLEIYLEEPRYMLEPNAYGVFGPAIVEGQEEEVQ